MSTHGTEGPRARVPGRPAPGALSVEGVSVVAAGKTLVDDVSLAVAPGEVVGLAGPNGAGKSTLLRTVYRALRPTRGRILLDGEDVWRMPGRRLARRLSAVLQESAGEFDLTVYDVVAMGRTPHKRSFEVDGTGDREIILAALGELGMAGSADAPFRRLSGGEKQRVLIARALAQRTGTMVLDEPTNHLDLRHQLDALRLVRGLGVTAVVALHDLNLAAAFCDRLCVLDGGRVVADGPPGEVLTAGLLADVYRVPAQVAVHPATGVPQVTLLHDAVPAGASWGREGGGSAVTG